MPGLKSHDHTQNKFVPECLGEDLPGVRQMLPGLRDIGIWVVL